MNLPLLPPCPRCFLFAPPTSCSVYARGTLTCKDPTRALWPLLLPAEFSHQRRVVRVQTGRGVKESYLIPPNPGWGGRGHISHSIALASRLLALPPRVRVAVLSDSPQATELSTISGGFPTPLPTFENCPCIQGSS